MDITARIQHSEQTIRILCRTQYNTFHFRRKALQCAAGLALALCGLYGLFGDWGAIVIFLGCWLLVSLNMPASSLARQTMDQLHGQFPKARYKFSRESFTFFGENGETTVPYGKLIRLVEDDKYAYLFVGELVTYMVDKSTVSGDVNAWKAAVAKHSGLSWTRTNQLLTYSLRSFRKNRAGQRQSK